MTLDIVFSVEFENIEQKECIRWVLVGKHFSQGYSTFIGSGPISRATFIIKTCINDLND